MWKRQQIVLSGKIKNIRQKIVKSEIPILMHKKTWSGRYFIA
jgi:hypothetical protein